jgi:hypothetical protein
MSSGAFVRRLRTAAAAGVPARSLPTVCRRLAHAAALAPALRASPSAASLWARRFPLISSHPLSLSSAARACALPARHFSADGASESRTKVVGGEASPPSPSPSSPSSPPPPWVAVLNEALALHPLETVAAYIGMDIASIGGAYLALTALSVDVPADFAVAFAASRLLRRVRLPVDLAVAGVLAKLYPPLTMVQPTKVFGGAFAPGAGAEGAAASPAGGVVGFLRRSGQSFARVLDRYGLAFLVAQRMFVGLTSVTSIYLALRFGVDVQGWLSSTVGLSLGSAGKVAGTWAAAACVAAFGFPGVVLGAGYIGRMVGRRRKGLKG